MLEANIALCISLVQYFDGGQPVVSARRLFTVYTSPASRRPGAAQAFGKHRNKSSLRFFLPARAGELLAAELARIFRMRDRHEWAERLEGAGVPFAPERALEDLENDPQVRATQRNPGLGRFMPKETNINFGFSEEENMLRSSVRAMMDKIATPEYCRRLDRNRHTPWLYKACGDGLLQMPFQQNTPGWAASST
jgi:hypothetical protein